MFSATVGVGLFFLAANLFGIGATALADSESGRLFLDAVAAYRIAEQNSRGSTVEASTFKALIQTLDRALPGLEGVTRGRALVLKAACFYWLHLDKMSRQRVFDAYAPPDPLLQEGLRFALEGRQILINAASDVDLPWADDIVRRLRDE